MGIVDLRGREHEPEVLALLAPEPGWMIVGWSRDERLVAAAGVERTSGDELVLQQVAGETDADAQQLIEAVVRVATGSRIVATVEPNTAALYRTCGFDVKPEPSDGASRVRCVRRLEEPPADAASVSAATLADVEAAIRSSWGRDTSDDPDEWSEQNPARGQCATTSLLVRELLGGDILVANVIRDGRRTDRHAWNRLSSGLTLDLTREQFVDGERFGEPSVEEPVLTHANPERYATLRTRVRAKLGLDS